MNWPDFVIRLSVFIFQWKSDLQSKLTLFWFSVVIASKKSFYRMSQACFFYLSDLVEMQLGTFKCMQITRPSMLLVLPQTQWLPFWTLSSLKRLFDWCRLNLLTPHPDKTELMLLGRRSFIGPLLWIRFGDTHAKQVFSTRCLCVEIDCCLEWDIRVWLQRFHQS